MGGCTVVPMATGGDGSVAGEYPPRVVAASTRHRQPEARRAQYHAAMDAIPPEAFLEPYPPAIRALAEELRGIVRRALPDAIERVRPGWHLIGYDVPGVRKPVYTAFIAPEPVHVHLGFEHGWAMRDPHGALRGEGVTKQVRWLVWEPGEAIDQELAIELLREAAAVARLSRPERLLRSGRALD
jgi:hypothetical protein